MPHALDNIQWCELHHGPAADVRAVRIGTHTNTRYTVMLCPECIKELVNELQWAQQASTFKWDYIIPDAKRYEMLIRFMQHANAAP